MSSHILTPYDEFPCHTTPYPVSYIPSTDYNWDEGYYFGILNPDEKIFIVTGFRINPNTDIISGYALVNIDGIQRTLRFSRCWKRDYRTHIGPFRLEFIEPLRILRLVVENNDSGISFDILWEGCSPAFLEDHHLAQRRGRRTTDLSRYTQPGTTSGRLKLGDRGWDLGRPGWMGVRDHSWGLYHERAPFAPPDKWLPPRPANPDARALRIWVVFKTGEISGFFHLHEDVNGVQRKLNDVFGTPFGGRFYRGWDSEVIEMAGARHELKFVPGTRVVTHARITLTDVDGGTWVQQLEVASPPWVVQTTGYLPGGWKDGGSVHSYHGSETLAIEWDEFDFSDQPFDYVPYGDAAPAERPPGSELFHGEKVQGVEYGTRIRLTGPDGRVYEGAGQLEVYMTGRYRPYGFE